MLTAYAVTKLLNTVLIENDLKPVPPQMLYNYVAKSMIPSSNKRISQSDADLFIATQLERRLAKAAKLAEQLEAELTAS